MEKHEISKFADRLEVELWGDCLSYFKRANQDCPKALQVLTNYLDLETAFGDAFHEACKWYARDYLEEKPQGGALLADVSGDLELPDEEELAEERKDAVAEISFSAEVKALIALDELSEERKEAFIEGWKAEGGYIGDIDSPAPWCAPWTWGHSWHWDPKGESPINAYALGKAWMHETFWDVVDAVPDVDALLNL